jgi:hypothetical protein
MDLADALIRAHVRIATWTDMFGVTHIICLSEYTYRMKCKGETWVISSTRNNGSIRNRYSELENSDTPLENRVAPTCVRCIGTP